MPDPGSLIENVKAGAGGRADGDLARTTALVSGSVAVGALITSSLFRRLRHRRLSAPHQLAEALEASTGEMEMMEGRVRFYQRDGTGTPVVLLHSVSAAASAHEMKPIFDHLAERTNRPLYAFDWLGFGRSDRMPVRYSPALYQRQLRRFLSEHVHQSADVVALSLSAEYAAEVARAVPYLVRKLVLISPTGLASRGTIPAWQRMAIGIASSVGAFEIFYYRLTRSEVLKRFYEHQIFQSGDVPTEVVEYARAATLVFGAHHAPRHFVQGQLTRGSDAARVYEQLRHPTLVIAPEADGGLIQHFDALEEVASRNTPYLEVRRLPAGLMPQWEIPEQFFDAVDPFLSTE